MNDLWNIIPTNPPISTVQLTGEEIWEMLEENLERTFSREPFDQMGGYAKRVLGLKVTAKLENPKGQRIQEIFIGDQLIEVTRVYHATFVTAQGVSPEYGKERTNLDVHTIDALKEYVSSHQTIEAPLRGTITLI